MKLPLAIGVAPAVRYPAVSVVTNGLILPEETAVAMVYDGTTHAVMMASPADLHDFALGFSLTEGIVSNPGQIASMDILPYPNGIEARMWLAEDRGAVLASRRRSLAGPVGCGLCGIDSIEAAVRTLPDLTGQGTMMSVVDMLQATDALRSWQPMHDRTRAVHAAGFLRPGWGIVLSREDVGRHNALDKLIGAMAGQGIDASVGAIVLTSRVSTEMVQKCAMAGCAVLIAVSAPTLHAVRLAQQAGMTLAAFARQGQFDLFCHPQRLWDRPQDIADDKTD